MDYHLSDKFSIKTQNSKAGSDFYMGAGGALEHVMDTLDNDSFYNKNPVGKCVQAFSAIQRNEHHVRIDRSSPCQDSNGKKSGSEQVNLKCELYKSVCNKYIQCIQTAVTQRSHHNCRTLYYMYLVELGL